MEHTIKEKYLAMKFIIQITQKNKIRYFEVKHNKHLYRFLDLYNYITTALKEWFKMFELKYIAKSDVPYHLRDWNFKGKFKDIPRDVWIRWPDDKELNRWLREQYESEKDYDFREGLLEYCKNNIQILKLECQKYKDYILNISKFIIDPL